MGVREMIRTKSCGSKVSDVASPPGACCIAQASTESNECAKVPQNFNKEKGVRGTIKRTVSEFKTSGGASPPGACCIADQASTKSSECAKVPQNFNKEKGVRGMIKRTVSGFKTSAVAPLPGAWSAQKTSTNCNQCAQGRECAEEVEQLMSVIEYKAHELAEAKKQLKAALGELEAARGKLESCIIERDVTKEYLIQLHTGQHMAYAKPECRKVDPVVHEIGEDSAVVPARPSCGEELAAEDRAWCDADSGVEEAEMIKSGVAEKEKEKISILA